MNKGKINHLKMYFGVSDNTPDEIIIKHLGNTMESARYDIRIAIKKLNKELEKQLPKIISRIFNIKG